MKSKVGRNNRCPCGSGAKYKDCCIKKSKSGLVLKSQNDWNKWVEKVSKLPFRAEVSSADGAEVSMKVSSAKVIRGDSEEILFNDEIEISTNKTSGDSTKSSKATFIVPQGDESQPEIATIGNASVSNAKETLSLSLLNNTRKMRAKSQGNLWASAKIGLQRNTGQQFFQLFFGVEGEKEEIDDSGMKNRPHIDFYPSGSGKFIRISGYKCELHSKQGYSKIDKLIFPREVRIVLEENHDELFLKFIFEGNMAILAEIKFKNDAQ